MILIISLEIENVTRNTLSINWYDIMIFKNAFFLLGYARKHYKNKNIGDVLLSYIPLISRDKSLEITDGRCYDAQDADDAHHADGVHAQHILRVSE